MHPRLPHLGSLLCALVLATALPAPAEAQLTPADSANVLLEAARDFEAEGRWDVAEAIYRLIADRYAATEAATEARARLTAPPEQVVYGDGSVELSVWMALYGAGLGVAVPGAFGADSPEPYGVGLLVGAPSGFLLGRTLARSLSLTEGQARAITFGGSWGAWQGFGWREVFDWGVEEICEPRPIGPEGDEFCYSNEDSAEEVFASTIVGSLAGITVGALLSNRDITPGTGTAVNFGALWGSWFGVAGGILMDLEDDDLLAAALVGGDAALLATVLLAPRWNVSRSRARLVSIGGVLGGLAGAGLDLLIQPDSEKVAVAIPLAGSVAGLVIGAWATRGGDGPDILEAAADGALLRLGDGRLGLALPLPRAVLVPHEGPRGRGWRAALGVELFRATF